MTITSNSRVNKATSQVSGCDYDCDQTVARRIDIPTIGELYIGQLLESMQSLNISNKEASKADLQI